MLLLIMLVALAAASMLLRRGRRMLYIASFIAGGLLVAGLIVWLINICDSEMRSADRSEQP